MKRRAFLAGLAGAAAVASIPMSTRKASAITTVSATFAEVNCNWHGYSDGMSAEGFDLTWATGTGATRKYIRARRLADQLRTQVKSSIYAVIECDEQMAKDLCFLMGSQWKYLGCKDVDHDKNGWLYDSSKWTPGIIAVTILPGGGNRRLLAAGFIHTATQVMLSSSVYHLSSNAPDDRALQMAKVLEVSQGKNRITGADLNASSPATGDYDDVDVSTLGPRSQLDADGWTTYGEAVGGWHGYDSDRDPLHIDYIGVSPTAQANGKISTRNGTWFDTCPTMSTDHCIIKVSVDFN